MAQDILKWGNSLAFRIPSAIAKQMGIDEGAKVEFHIDGKRLIIEKQDEQHEFSYAELIRSLRKARREVVDLGRSRGKEML